MSISTAAAPDTRQLELLARARRLAESGEARSIRISTKTSLSEIATACGVDTSTVGRWECNVRRPRGIPGARYAVVLDMLARTS